MNSAPSLKLRARLRIVYGILAVMNVGAWTWALYAFYSKPQLISIALVVYGLGMRHAVDADHIAAIDNVTRKLMQGGDRPIGVGFFFALGHSLVVVMATAAVAAALGRLNDFERFRGFGSLISTGVSALFLCGVAAMNVLIFASVCRKIKRMRAGDTDVGDEVDLLFNNRGLLSRVFRPVFRLISSSWQMALIGLLFGLGFDTASEVAMFGMSAAQLTHGTSMLGVMVFPCLFAAGMALVDTTDGVLMLGAYEWAFVTPLRKLHYNMLITAVSIIVAVLIATIEILNLLRDHTRTTGAFWRGADALAFDMNSLGICIVGVFMAAWAISLLIHRLSLSTSEALGAK